jgi:hypothetical protein
MLPNIMHHRPAELAVDFLQPRTCFAMLHIRRVKDVLANLAIVVLFFAKPKFSELVVFCLVADIEQAACTSPGNLSFHLLLQRGMKVSIYEK